MDKLNLTELRVRIFTKPARRRSVEIIDPLKRGDGAMARLWKAATGKRVSVLARRSCQWLLVMTSPCWLCGRPLGGRIEFHHPVPKSRDGRDRVPIHPICHRTLHRVFSNAELALFGDTLASIRADLRIGRFLTWIANKHPDFHAPTHRSS